MRMTVVIDELNEGHAVLMIRTDRGDYILDNKTQCTSCRGTRPATSYVKREGHDSDGLDLARRRDLADRDREPLSSGRSSIEPPQPAGEALPVPDIMQRLCAGARPIARQGADPPSRVRRRSANYPGTPRLR